MPNPKDSPKKSRKRTPDWRPAQEVLICPLADLPQDSARGFTLDGPQNERLEIIVWHRDGAVLGFVNQCPHLGLPLETFPDRFLSADATHLICSAHGAQFDPTGHCFAGPCKGDGLMRLDIGLRDGAVYLNAP